MCFPLKGRLWACGEQERWHRIRKHKSQKNLKSKTECMFQWKTQYIFWMSKMTRCPKSTPHSFPLVYVINSLLLYFFLIFLFLLLLIYFLYIQWFQYFFRQMLVKKLVQDSDEELATWNIRTRLGRGWN